MVFHLPLLFPEQNYAAVLGYSNVVDGLFTTFQVSTVSSWRYVVEAAALTTSSCNAQCAKFYFFLVKVTTGMIILPMFVGFVIEAFNSTLPVVTKDYIASREARQLELRQLSEASPLVGSDTDRARDQVCVCVCV